MKIFWNLLLVLLPAYTFSQSNWRNSVVTLQDGTVLSGEINDFGWEYPPKEIEFRKEGQPVQKFSVDEVVHFATDRPIRYESHIVSYDADGEDLGSLSKSKEPINLIREKLFLEVKVNGTIGLLYMKSKNGRAHYFIKQDTTVTELLNRTYFSAKNNREILTNQKYKQQLLLITNDCPDIQSGLSRLLYSESRLADATRKINACKNYEVDPLWDGAPSNQKKKSTYGVVLQAMLSSCNFQNYYHGPTDGINFGGGLFWELYNKKRPNKLSLYNELTYKKISSEKGTSYFGFSEDFKCTKIKLINAIKFSSPNRSGGRFYGGIGINNGFRTDTMISGRTKMTSTGKDFSSGYEVGFTAMIGQSFILLQKLKISPEIRYDYEYDLSGTFIFSSYSLNLQVGVKF